MQRSLGLRRRRQPAWRFAERLGLRIVVTGALASGVAAICFGIASLLEQIATNLANPPGDWDAMVPLTEAFLLRPWVAIAFGGLSGFAYAIPAVLIAGSLQGVFTHAREDRIGAWAGGIAITLVGGAAIGLAEKLGGWMVEDDPVLTIGALGYGSFCGQIGGLTIGLDRLARRRVTVVRFRIGDVLKVTSWLAIAALSWHYQTNVSMLVFLVAINGALIPVTAGVVAGVLNYRARVRRRQRRDERDLPWASV